MRTLAEALGILRCFLVTIPLIYLSTIVMGSISLLVSLADRTGRAQHACARLWARSLLFVSGARVTVRGLEHFTPGRACIFAANHQSYMDIPVAFGYLPGEFRIMAKASLFHIPFLGWHLRRSGHVSIARDNPRRAARSLLEAASRVRQGTSVFVFPEGGRSLDGRLGEFKAGTFLLAIKAAAPVIPVTINGTRAVLRRNSFYIRAGWIEMILHAPIPTEGMHTDSAEKLCEQVRAMIAEEFNEATAVAPH